MIGRIFAFCVLIVPFAATAGECPLPDAQWQSSPTFARPAAGQIYKAFGMVVNPLLAISRMHTGVDFAGTTGEPIVAAAPGIVREVSSGSAFGKLVVVDHGGGWQTAYAHLDRIDVVAGACAVGGEKIGTVGSTGLSTGPHLHFEIRRDGRPVNPTPLLVSGSEGPKSALP